MLFGLSSSAAANMTGVAFCWTADADANPGRGLAAGGIDGTAATSTPDACEMLG